MSDMLISSFAFVGAIISTVCFCFDFLSDHSECHKSFTVVIMIVSAIVTILNLMLFGLFKGTRKRMWRDHENVTNSPVTNARNDRNTMTSVEDALEAEHVDLSFLRQKICIDATTNMNHNYVNLIT